MIDEIFKRTSMLYGEENLLKIQNSRVAVFGLGGVGGYIVEALARFGISKLDIIDNDIINKSNINRQILALQNNIGENKTDACENRILNINPNCVVNKYNMFFTKENQNEIPFSDFDYIADAIDTVSSKLLLVEIANELNIPIISSMGTGNKTKPYMFEVSDIFKTSVCPLARVMRYELKKRNIKKLKVVYSKEEPKRAVAVFDNQRKIPPASCSFVPPVAGLIIAGEIINDLLCLKLKK